MEQIGGQIQNMGGRGGGGAEGGRHVRRRKVARLRCVSAKMENPMSVCACCLGNRHC